MANIGDTFGLSDRRIEDHLHVIISDPAKDPNKIVTANFTSWRTDKDQSCIIEAGEHRFIQKRTCVNYAQDRLITLAQYEQFLASREVYADDPVSKDLLGRILRGAEISPHLSLGNREILIEQGLIDAK